MQEKSSAGSIYFQGHGGLAVSTYALHLWGVWGGVCGVVGWGLNPTSTPCASAPHASRVSSSTPV